jgi:non-ribosomal peptide synthetase component E (peptide arylation enzyme)
MMLGDPTAPHLQAGESTTLDELFRQAVARRPDALALSDPPDRTNFCGGKARRLTYAQADHIVSAIAGRLRRLGLATDTTIALQLPNTVESVLTLLGVIRAGMIAAPLPLLWRRADAAAALSRIGARAFITTAQVGATEHCVMAREVAADLFSIRYVCSFGVVLPDGVIPFDDLLTEAPLLDPPQHVARSGNPAGHIAVVTFEATAGGLMPVARNHLELIAGGEAVRLEAQFEDDAAILASCGSSSFAGLSLGVVSWLLAGGTLSLHQPFDAATFASQCHDDGCDTVVIPGVLAPRIAQAGLLTHPKLRTIVALWRAPERLHVIPPFRHQTAGLTDVLAFGETGLIAARRGAAGQPADIPLGPVLSPRGATNAGTILETIVTDSGTLALRGPMVPRHPYPPGTERTPLRCFKPDEHGFADTGYPCRADRMAVEVTVTGPPAGLIAVGGYRFRPDQLQELVGEAAPDAVLAALPDAISGHRLAGTARDRAELRHTLEQRGVSPLVSGAFVERRRVEAA